jgi:Na+/glutamate symporter
MRISPVITLEWQPLIVVIQILLGVIVFNLTRWLVGRPLSASTNSLQQQQPSSAAQFQQSWPYSRGDMKRATKLATTALSLFYQTIIVCMCLILQWELKEWVPSLFQQLMIALVLPLTVAHSVHPPYLSNACSLDSSLISQ